jgi:hypothetical protein
MAGLFFDSFNIDNYIFDPFYFLGSPTVSSDDINLDYPLEAEFVTTTFEVEFYQNMLEAEFDQ